MDNFNIKKFFKDQYITEGSCGYTLDGEPRNKPAGPNEAEAIGLSPGEMERGDDGRMHNVVMSNAKRKMAMRSVLDILKSELGVSNDDAFDYIRIHRDDLFDGTVDAFSKEEVVDDYNEYMSVNMDSISESINLSDYNEDVEKAIEVGIRVGSNFDEEDVMYYVHNNWMAGNLSAEEAMKKINKYLSPR